MNDVADITANFIRLYFDDEFNINEIKALISAGVVVKENINRVKK